MISKYIPQLSYWIDVAPAPLDGWRFMLPLLIFIAFFVGGLAAKIVASKTDNFKMRTILFKFGSLGWVMGLVGVLLIFFEYERVALFRMRIFFILWALASVLWSALIIVRLRKELPTKLERIQEFLEKKKYWPKKK